MKELHKPLQNVIPLFLLPFLAWFLGRNLPGWVLMWMMAFGLYAGTKILTRQDIPSGIQGKGKWTYYLGWPGMDPRLFFESGKRGQLVYGLKNRARLNIVIGGICLGVVAPRFLHAAPLLAGWVGMSGLIFLLHFGLFHLLALHWQRKGYGAEPIMNAPHLARSLADFWGRRWNRAFQCLTLHYVFTPLRKKMSPLLALWICFLVSGLIHELVITLPARGGYGGPTVYFLVQGLGLMVEKRFRTKLHTVCMRIWTLGVVILPAGLLFPPEFVYRIMIPMFRAWGIFPK
jgi:hypothetical protein